MRTMLVAGTLEAGQLLYQVKAQLDGLDARCYVGEDMYFLTNLSAELVVLFVHTGSQNEEHPSFGHLRNLAGLLAATDTPCIIVYGRSAPSYLPNHDDLNVLASFVPPPPIGRPVRVDDSRGKHCYFLRSATDIASVILNTMHRAKRCGIDKAAQ